jgi:hypothetical protein
MQLTNLNDISKLHTAFQELLQERALPSTDIALHTQCHLATAPKHILLFFLAPIQLGNVLHDFVAVVLVPDANFTLYNTMT